MLQALQFIDFLSLASQSFTEEKKVSTTQKRRVMIITLNNGEEIGLLVCTLVKDGEEEREYLPSSKFLASLCSAYSLSVSEGTSKHVLVCE